MAPLLPVSEPDLRSGLTLFESSDRLGAFGAVLAAAAMSLGAAALVSADRGFSTVRGLDHVVPDAGGVARLLSD